MKVLIAVDGSGGGYEAVRQAGRLLAPGNDQIAFYYSPPEVRLGRSGVEPSVLERARQALAAAVFEEALTHLPPALREGVQTIVGQQKARLGVPIAAEQFGAELIAVGARGLGPLKRLLLGSVSRSVAHVATVPVLVARPRLAAAAADAPRVLVACEDIPSARPLVEVLHKFTWPAETTGRAMTVVQSLFVGQIPPWLEQKTRSEEVESVARAWVEEHKAEVAATEQQMAQFCQGLPQPFRTARPIVAEGHPTEQILAAINREASDLVVVGACGSGPVARLLMGSTSEAVLAYAPCSVLVVRQAQRA